jgi:hypothetical protein
MQRKSLWIGRSDTLNDPWELAINPTYLAERTPADERTTRGGSLSSLAHDHLHILLVRIGA